MTTDNDRRPLRGLLGAVGVSGLGTRMSFLALPWFVLTTTGSATRTGIVAFAEMGPYVGVQALGGPVVDRLGAKRVSVGTDLVAAIFVGLVPGLAALHRLTLPVLILLVVVAGAARGAGDSARDVLVPGVGEIADVPIERSSGFYDGVSRLATLVGMPLAGALVLVTSALNVLAIDAGTFAVSALLVLSFVPTAAQPQRQTGVVETEASYLASLAEGFRYLLHDRLLMAIAAMVLVTNFVDQAGGAVLSPVWAHEIAHSSLALGLLGGAFSLGAVAGNALTTWLGPRLNRRMTYAVGFFVAGAPRYVALGLAASVSPVLAVAFLGGLGAGGINPVLGAVEYERVPRHLQARVLGAVGASAWAGIPVGSLAGGLAVATFGLRPALFAAAVVYGVATLTPFVFPVWRQMDRVTTSQDVGEEAGASVTNDTDRPVSCDRDPADVLSRADA
jgi:MFS family permease